MTKKIPILFIITKLELGGAQKICLSLFRNLKKDGHHAFLFSGASGTLAEKVKQEDHVFLSKHFKREASFSLLLSEIKNFLTLYKYIKKLKKKHPNLIIHTHSTKAGIIGRWAAWCAGIKTKIHTIHGYGFHPYQNKFTWYATFLSEWITSLITNHFICVSQKDADTGKKYFPRFEKKHSLIRAAVDDSYFEPATKAENKDLFVFGTVACFKPQKNLFDLLNAFKQVHQKNNKTRLEIIGDGILRTQIEQWIQNNTLENVITLHGWQDNVKQFMLCWDTFVLSSLWEGLPCAVIEARLCHLPVIAYDTGGISEIINDGKNGFLIEQGNKQELQNKMQLISQSPIEPSDNNLEDFKIKNMIQKHSKLFKKFI